MHFVSRDLFPLTVVGGVCLVTDSSSRAYLAAARYFGEGVGTNFTSTQLNNGTGGSTVFDAVTAEKSNSRSSGASGTYGSASVEAATGVLVRIGIAVASHVGFVFGHRYAPVATQSGEVVSFGGGTINSGDLCFAVSEGGFTQGRIGARKSRKGYFFRFGNEIHHAQKSGSGSYNQIMPHFDNDITWVDPSAWKLGHVQSDVWNMQLFGVEADAFPPLWRPKVPYNFAQLRM